jgi:hypothetical protein
MVGHEGENMTQDEIIEELKDLYRKLQIHWDKNLWIDATHLVVILKAIELLEETKGEA